MFRSKFTAAGGEGSGPPMSPDDKAKMEQSNPEFTYIVILPKEATITDFGPKEGALNGALVAGQDGKQVVRWTTSKFDSWPEVFVTWRIGSGGGSSSGGTAPSGPSAGSGVSSEVDDD